MPRKSVFPPTIRQHKQKGLDRVWWEKRWIYLGPTGSQESQEAYARLIAELAAGQPAPRSPRAAPAGPTVADVAAAWMTHAEKRYDPRGRECEQFRLSLRPLERLYGSVPAAEFRARHLEAVKQAMADGSWLNAEERTVYEARGIPQKWCANVCNRRLVRIRTVWRWAEKMDLVPPGAYTHLLSVEGFRSGEDGVRHTPKVRPATWLDVKAVARECFGTVKAMLLLHWWSGMRSEEVRELRAGDVDTTDPKGWVYRPRQHKTLHRGQTRAVALGPRATAVLRPWLEAAAIEGPDAFVFPPEPGRRRQRKDGSVSPRPPYDRRRCYTDQSYPRAVARAAARAGVTGLSPYQARHAAKKRITAAVGLDAARAVLGQRSLDSTNHYADAADLDLARNVQRRLG